MSAFTPEIIEENSTDRICLLGNWVEERATAFLDRSGPKSCINKNGHVGIITVDVTATVQGVTTFKDAFSTPKSHVIRQRGKRTELLEKDLVKRISEQIHAELNPEPPAPEWSSVSKSDYRVEGFKSFQAPLTEVCEHNYTTDRAITFWSDNYQKIQGVTAVTTDDSPFKRNATFSTPISDKLDCQDDTHL
ncbi:hypothetical protein E1301_Tti009469 [Triplophysa tibetana]|uniref:Sperm-associated antigen 8 n=1 Tax=Triplophysa tibetana TaxID=1572043 RepID=A0A5A9P415_9TELE|nr:hypothetical protein E1301_Tti009469 [Triplophysa tibetana]